MASLVSLHRPDRTSYRSAAGEPPPASVPLAGFDTRRIHLLPRSGKTLVIDQPSGRWILASERLTPDFGLLELSQRGIELDSAQHERVTGLQHLLEERGIGAGAPRTFQQFNTVILKLTKACNFACTYCYDFEHGDKARRMEEGLLLEAARQAVDLADCRVHFILHGGEPMLAWKLIETLVLETEQYARTRNVEVLFTGQTNLSLLTDRIVSFSLQHNVLWGISQDGRAEDNDRFRVLKNGKGTHDVFLEALETYPDFVRSSNVMSTITRANCGKLLETARYFKDLGMAGWDWSLFQAIGRGREAQPFDIETDRLLESWIELFAAVEAGEFGEFAVLPVLKYLNNFVGGPSGNMCMRSQCGAARDLLSVSHDGSIEACDSLDPQGDFVGLGHVTAGGLSGAHSSPIADLIRSRDVTKGRCGSCAWFGVCGGTCLAHAGGLHDVWDSSCALSLVAFDAISKSLATGTQLLDYRNQFMPPTPEHTIDA